MLKVSVIIPVYNAHNYLERCLDSVCNQTLTDIEIICVDDCSTDDSLEILNKYASQYPQIKVIHHEINGGESKARNTGIDAANGEYLAFVDNDDTVDLDFYEKLYNKAKQTNADIVKAAAHIYDYNGTQYFDNINEQIRKHHSKLYFKSFWWTAIYKRKLISDIRFLEGYPLGGDVLFLNKLILKCNKLELVDGTYYNYYRRENSGDSRVLTFEKVKSVLEIHEMILNNTLNANIEDKQGIEQICIWSVTNALNYAYRNKTLKNLDFCIEKLIIFWETSKEYINENNLTDVLPIILNSLKSEDREQLKNLFLKYDTAKKMSIANLRYLHLKKGYK